MESTTHIEVLVRRALEHHCITFVFVDLHEVTVVVQCFFLVKCAFWVFIKFTILQHTSKLFFVENLS